MMKKNLFKTLLICSCLIAVIPVFATTSCVNKQDPVSYIVDIVENPQSSSLPVQISQDGCLSNAINKYAYENYFSHDHSILKNEIIYDSFHLIKEKGLVLNNIGYTKQNENLIDLYKKNVVIFSATISSNNSIDNHAFPDLKKNSISVSFQAALFIEFIKDYKVNDSRIVSAGTIINCIPEFYEPEMVVCYQNAEACPDDYYKDSTPYRIEDNKYKWRPLYPSFNQKFHEDEQIEKVFGVITILEKHISVVPITLEYMTEDVYTDYQFNEN